MRHLREWVPEIALVVVTTAAGIWAGGRWLSPMSDAGIWWSLPVRLASGERLYRDIYLQYGPLSPYLVSWAARPFGFSASSILVLSWIPAVVAALLLLRLARPFLTTVERLCLAAILIGTGLFAPGLGRLVYPYSPAAVHALCFALVALLLVRAPECGGLRGAAAGLLAGLAVCSKQEVGIAAAAALTAGALVQPRGERRWLAPCLAAFAVAVAGGAAFVLTSTTLESLKLDNHLWPLAAPPPLWRRLFAMIAGFAPGLPGRLLSSLRGFALAASLFALAGLLAARERRTRRLLPVAAVFLVLLLWDVLDGSLSGRNLGFLHLWMCMAFAVALWALLDRRRPHRDWLVAFGVFAGLVGSRSAFSGDLGNPYAGVSHLPGALALLLFVFVFLPDAWPGGGPGESGEKAVRYTRRAWAFVLLPVVCLGAAIGVVSLRSGGNRPVDTPRGRIWAGRSAADLYERVGRELRPGERVLSLPEVNAVDALFEARSVSPFVIMMPGSLDARAEERLIRRFEREPPEVVVVFRRPTWEYGVAPFGQGYGQRLAAWIETHDRLVASSAAGTIWRRMNEGEGEGGGEGRGAEPAGVVR
ncbi:MAG TPA: glycosyltransferase family 39 protein [Thermoanaerobaculia bacterium]|jgi:hypothetical protein